MKWKQSMVGEQDWSRDWGLCGLMALTEWLQRDGWGLMLLSEQFQVLSACDTSLNHINRIQLVDESEGNTSFKLSFFNVVALIQRQSQDVLLAGIETQLEAMSLRIRRLQEPQEGVVGPAYLVLSKLEPEAPMEMVRQRLQDRFQWTAKELTVAFTLAEGCNIQQAADTLSLSHHTVRAHLRSLFSKANITSQSQLIALILQEFHRCTVPPQQCG